MTYGKAILNEGQYGRYDCSRAIIEEPKAPKKKAKPKAPAKKVTKKPAAKKATKKPAAKKTTAKKQ